MNLINHIWFGLKKGIQYKWVALYILLIQLILATLIGVLSYIYIHDSIGHSTNLLKIIEGYDHDVFQDLLRFESTGWVMIKVFTVVVVLLYLLIGPFIMGGLLKAYHEQKDGWETFWTGGSRYYFSFLKLNLIILGIFLFFLAVFSAFGVFLTNYGIKHFLSELPTLWILSLTLIFFVLIVITLVSTSTHAKWMFIKGDVKVWTAFVNGFRYIKQNLFYYLVLGILFLIISMALAMLFNFAINCIPESGFLLILLALALQVMALFIRVCIRNGYYSAILSKK